MNRDLLNGYKQRFPCLVEIEPVEGCNLGCSFCGLRGIRKHGTRPWKMMDVETAETIARKIADEGWRSRISFCGHGEPTINPDLLKIIAVFRQYLPDNDFSILTNGYGFRNEVFDINDFYEEVCRLCVNDIIFDVYAEDGDWRAIYRLPEEVLSNVRTMGVDDTFRNAGRKRRQTRIMLYPLEVEKKSLRKMQNHCGAAAPLDYRREHTVCTKPFRELFIRWNGRVALCCDDFRGQYFIDDATRTDRTLDEIWNDERFQAARIRLFNRDRTFKPCYGCDNPPNKAGFLPDITGGRDKDKMPKEITEEVIQVTKEAYLPEGLTTIFRRKWEQE